MKQKWEVQRTGVKRLDGQRRWDIAYQRLLQWSSEIGSTPDKGTFLIATEEVKDESRHLCPSINLNTTTEPNY